MVRSGSGFRNMVRFESGFQIKVGSGFNKYGRIRGESSTVLILPHDHGNFDEGQFEFKANFLEKKGSTPH